MILLVNKWPPYKCVCVPNMDIQLIYLLAFWWFIATRHMSGSIHICEWPWFVQEPETVILLLINVYWSDCLTENLKMVLSGCKLIQCYSFKINTTHLIARMWWMYYKNSIFLKLSNLTPLNIHYCYIKRWNWPFFVRLYSQRIQHNFRHHCEIL